MKGERGWQAGDYLDRPLRELLDDTAGPAPIPAAGSAVAATAALAAALVAKIARRSTSYRADPSASTLEAASLAPGVVVDAGTALAEIAADLAENGNPRPRYDAVAAERLATTAAQVAASLVAANAAANAAGNADTAPNAAGDGP